MGRNNTESHAFYCINCGQAGIPLARRKNRQRERFHRKVMYCYHCGQDVNHVECKDYNDIQIFKENFAKGVYKNEAEESLAHVRNTREWKINLVCESGM
jgi:hypothetical protein